MYIPQIFKVENPNIIKDYVKKNGFGILLNFNSQKILGTHIPMLMEEDPDDNQIILTGHISKFNPQKTFFLNSSPTLAIFSNHQAYISSSWYNHPNVPTWNYIAVHVYGKIYQQNEKSLLTSLNKLVDQYEMEDPSRFRIENLEEKNLQKQLKGIIGFKLKIESIEASYKLSQNRNDTDYSNIIQNLKERNDKLSAAIADEMIKMRSFS